MIRPQIVTLSTKGQLILPRALRLAAGLLPGAKLNLTLSPDGTITARPIRGTLEAFFHALDNGPGGGPVDIDEAIMAAVADLDGASHRG